MCRTMLILSHSSSVDIIIKLLSRNGSVTKLIFMSDGHFDTMLDKNMNTKLS